MSKFCPVRFQIVGVDLFVPLTRCIMPCEQVFHTGALLRQFGRGVFNPAIISERKCWIPACIRASIEALAPTIAKLNFASDELASARFFVNCELPPEFRTLT